MMRITNYLLAVLIGSGLLFTSCGDDDVPAAENEEEVINEVILTFTPEGGGDALVASYLDEDGEGSTFQPVKTEINLSVSTTYTLAITFKNSVQDPAEDITAEVEEEGEEHQLFYSWTNDIFINPAGNGNINSTGAVNYLDEDTNSNPIGLSTSWTTAANATSDGTFRLLLKHQPNIKSATTTSNDGETDIDISWVINIQ